MTWESYRTLTFNQRFNLHREIDRLIEETSPSEGGSGLGNMARPKSWRK